LLWTAPRSFPQWIINGKLFHGSAKSRLSNKVTASSSTALAILDSQPDQLHYPLLHVAPKPPYLSQEGDENEGDLLPEIDKVDVFQLLKPYMHWTGELNEVGQYHLHHLLAIHGIVSSLLDARWETRR
jgi:hypothetical protein